jgi:alpha-ketoglutarate-dependent taurine dioxygenase
MEIRSIDGTFAREVQGVNLWQGLSPAQLEEIRAAWRECGVLVFRRQSLSEKELVEVSAIFGKPQPVHRTDWTSAEHPEVVLVSNLKDQDGKQIGMPGSNDVDWHTDQSYVTNPSTGAMLYAVEIPNDGGGSTWWTNMRAGYDELPMELKRQVEGKRAVLSYLKRLAGYNEQAAKVTEEMLRKTPPVAQPLVYAHPVTGRKSMFLDPTTTVGVEGMSDQDGLALVDALVKACTQPQQVYRHQWHVGDVVLWDNALTMHRRDEYESRQRRFLKRTTIALPEAHHIIPRGQQVERTVAIAAPA